MVREFQITSGGFDHEYSQVRKGLTATIAEFQSTSQGDCTFKLNDVQVDVFVRTDYDDVDSVKVRLLRDGTSDFDLRTFYIDTDNPDDDIEETVRAIIDMIKCQQEG